MSDLRSGASERRAPSAIEEEPEEMVPRAEVNAILDSVERRGRRGGVGLAANLLREKAAKAFLDQDDSRALLLRDLADEVSALSEMIEAG